MDTALVLPKTGDRKALFDALFPQVEALLNDGSDAIAAMANLAAALHAAFAWHWTGFYRVVGQELVLGPFQGPVACSRIPYGKGVCGTAWKENRTLIVADVDAFPGHIACSVLSRSEVVVPICNTQGEVMAVLDIDSVLPNDFDENDGRALERLCKLLSHLV